MLKTSSITDRAQGLRVTTSPPQASSTTVSVAEQRLRNVGSYGLAALATVVFDIDAGQRLDALYPTSCGLSDDAHKSIAHLALPHSNKQDEGDTQFIVRFRAAKDSPDFLYGFVLFRQQRDASRSRGYLQRALVIVTTKPFVDLYDRVLRVIGPLFFQAGNSVLEALYENIVRWPALVKDTPLTLPLAGTYVSCVVPDLLDYNQIDAGAAISSIHSPSPTGHFLADREEAFEEEDAELSHADDIEASAAERDAVDGSEDEHEDDHGDHTDNVVIKEGQFVVTKQTQPPSPSFGDVLMAKRSNHSTPFENIGLYSSFMGLETCLWQLWQFAVTGESLVILSPHARTCSQATLAMTSLIAPLKFEGDYRPYYALYEVDFDEISSRQGDGVSTPERMTIIGTTNPFFMKSFKRWPNAMIFPFLETNDKPVTRSRSGSLGALSLDASTEGDFVSVRIKPTADLDTLEDCGHAVLLRRRPRFMNIDTTVLNQLVTPPEVVVTQTASTEEEPYIAINNAILRRHFRKLTKRFLRPFDQYFGVWKSNSTNSNLYVSTKDILKPFDLKSFLASVNPRKLPPQIKKAKWRALYTAFVKSPHFEPWFTFRRHLCVYQFTQTLRVLRASVTPEMLLTAPTGGKLPLIKCEALEQEIMAALKTEKEQQGTTPSTDESDQIRVIEAHLKAVRRRIQELLG